MYINLIHVYLIFFWMNLLFILIIRVCILFDDMIDASDKRMFNIPHIFLNNLLLVSTKSDHSQHSLSLGSRAGIVHFIQVININKGIRI